LLLQFYKTIDERFDFEPARTIGSYIWCRPYLELSPETCFVLDDGEGRAVGYIIGTTSTVALISDWENKYLPRLQQSFPSSQPSWYAARPDEPGLVKHLRRDLDNAACSMVMNYPEILKKYPAHLHINILPVFHRKGWGSQLIGTYLAKIKKKGCDGVHLGMVKANDGARRFYDRLGFRVCDVVLDGGKSGEVGVAGNGLCLVKEL
jgi:ribosomal protein S18 acetylase RimI-like enzyme